MSRIALLVQSLESGGSERSAAVISELMDQNNDVYVISFTDKGKTYQTKGEYYSLNSKVSNNIFYRIYEYIKKCIKLARYLKNEKIDIVLSFGSDANNCLAFTPYRCKKVISGRGYKYYSEHKKWYHFLLKIVSGVLFNSEEMSREHLHKYPTDKEKVFCVQNIMDTTSISELSEQDLNEEEQRFYDEHQVIVCVGRFSYEKGQWNLIKAFNYLKKRSQNIGLVFVGHMGAYEKEIYSMAVGCPYKGDILFVGYQNNPYKYVRNARVFAIPSLKEGFPNVVIEAMAVGTPIVAADFKTGAKELIAGDSNFTLGNLEYAKLSYGILTQPFSNNIDFDWSNVLKEHKIFAEAMHELLNNEELRATMMHNIRKKALTFDVEYKRKEYEKLIYIITNK